MISITIYNLFAPFKNTMPTRIKPQQRNPHSPIKKRRNKARKNNLDNFGQ